MYASLCYDLGVSSLRRPSPKYGWKGNIQIGSRVRYRKDIEPSEDMDSDCTLDDHRLPNGEILGEVTDGPDDDDYGKLWEVAWIISGLSSPLPWWTYEELLEVA